ncbi:MAG: NAD(P)/FAD-dependent oxidoreductase [Promethearchaeota archaeon]
MKYVIIGNGVAGITAVQVLSKSKTSKSTITQFTDEEFSGYYNRPKIPSFIANYNMTVEDIITYSQDWYRKLDVDLHLQEKVQKIDTKTQEILTTKASYPFDRLLIATGADSWSPPIGGQELKHFYTVRNLKDALKIRERFKSSKTAVIIGGGVLGIEIANAAIQQDLKVTVIEFFPYLLPRQLDMEGSQILHNILEYRGMKILVGKEVQSVLGKKKVAKVVTKDGLEIPADLVITCTGIKPRVTIAKDILKVNRGIVVNNYLETSQKDIFAAGDCAEHNGIIYGLIPPTIQQAQIAASNMLNTRSKEYTGSKVSSSLKVTDIFLSSFGYTGKEKESGYNIRKYTNEREYVKLFIDSDKLKAAIILGVRKVIPLIRNIFTQELSLSDHETELRNILHDLVEN